MDTVIPAFIVLFTALAVLGSIAHVSLDSHDRLSEAQAALSDRLVTVQQTHLTTYDTYLTADGTELTLYIENTGGVTLADYDEWDVIMSYVGESNSSYHTWLPFGAEAGQWSVDTIYLDPERGIEEAHDRNCLNPGEIAALVIPLTDPVKPGTTLTASISTANSRGTLAYAHRNAPPELVVNDRLVLAIGATADITTVILEATDVDHLPGQIEYVIENAPTDGTLSRPDGFTQADINAGNLAYTHTAPGYGTDSVTFSLTDSIDTVGPFTLDIKISAPPTLVAHTALTVADGGTAVLTPAHLTTDDPDDTAENLRYEAQTAPLNGTLSPMNFTQADLAAGLVTYTHNGVGSGADSFQFTVTDGVNTIGNYHFEITVN